MRFRVNHCGATAIKGKCSVRLVRKTTDADDDDRVNIHVADQNGSGWYVQTISGEPLPFTIKAGDVVAFGPPAEKTIEITLIDDAENKGASTMKTNDLEILMAKFASVGVERAGEKIVVPDGMPMDVAIEWLRRRMVEEDQVVAVVEPIENAYVLDGAYAFVGALSQRFGWAAMVPTPSFWGPEPPTMIAVDTGVGTSVRVPWGRFKIPGIDGYLETGVGRKDGRPVFQITGEVKRKHQGVVAEIAKLTRDFLRANSLYRGQAIRMWFPDYSQKFDPSTDVPRFIDVSHTNEHELIFSEAVREQIEVSIFTPIRKTQECRNAGIPLKRGVLLAGPWGVGKTLTAYVAAVLAKRHGWTFIYLEDVRQLSRAIPFARQYSPAVIFAEDIDRVASSREDEDTGELLNEILNTIDGVDSKQAEVMVVLTTNHLANIDPSLLRPGRLDAVIPVTPPDAKAAEALVRLYAKGLLAEDIDLTPVGHALDGKIAAIVREVVERSKLAALRRSDTVVLNASDLLVAARGMNEHLELLATKQPDNRSEEVKAAAIYGTAVGQALRSAVDEVRDEVRSLLTADVG